MGRQIKERNLHIIVSIQLVSPTSGEMLNGKYFVATCVVIVSIQLVSPTSGEDST